MKIMIKYNYIKEIVKGAHTDPTPEQRAPKIQSYRLWLGAADQCTLSHGTYIQIKI